MHNPFEMPLFIEVKPSRWFKILYYMAHLGAILALQGSEISHAIQILLSTCVLISLIYGHQLYISRKHPDSAVRLILNQTGGWLLVLSNGNEFPVTLKPMAFVHPTLVVMSFHGDGRTFRIMLTPDTVDADTFRRLRVRLRFKNRDE